jgi:predicted cation transporter
MTGFLETMKVGDMEAVRSMKDCLISSTINASFVFAFLMAFNWNCSIFELNEKVFYLLMSLIGALVNSLFTVHLCKSDKVDLTPLQKVATVINNPNKTLKI